MHSRSLSFAVRTSLLLAIYGEQVSGQLPGTVRVVPLPAANAALPEEFTRLLSVRELAGGRVVLTEDKDNRIAVADFNTGAVRTLGRAGDGPGEYRAVGRLWDVGGDSTFMSVPYRRRWLLLHRDSIVRTYTGQLPVILAIGSEIVRGADARGNVLTIAPMVRTPGKPFSMPDSFVYIRSNRASLKADTVLKTVNSDKNMSVEGGARAAGPGPPPEKRIYHVSLKARDQLAMFTDGVVAVLRGNPFRVDWCVAPGKPCTIGPLQENDSRAWTDADKGAYLKVMNGLGAWPPTENVDQTVGWPDKLPAFASPGGPDEANFWATRSGNVVVERVPTAKDTLLLYDVINRNGQLVARVSVPPAHRVVGFGAKSVYVVHVDGDNIQRLQRHAWAY